MDKPRRGRPPIYRDRIIAMKLGKTLFFSGACQNSIKSITSRLGRALDREYATSGLDGGVWVERNK